MLVWEGTADLSELYTLRLNPQRRIHFTRQLRKESSVHWLHNVKGTPLSWVVARWSQAAEEQDPITEAWSMTIKVKGVNCLSTGSVDA